MNNPWETDEFIEFLNDINELATKKYGWDVTGHQFEGVAGKYEILNVCFTPAIGADAENRKF